MINLKGINHKNKHHVQYPVVPSVIRPIPHGLDVPVPEPDDNKEYSSYFDMTKEKRNQGRWAVKFLANYCHSFVCKHMINIK